MSNLAPQCQQLQSQVETILQLLHPEPALRSQDITFTFQNQKIISHEILPDLQITLYDIFKNAGLIR